MSKEYLDKAGLTYLWSKLKAYIKKDYDRTVSRGEQLVTNGSGMLGNNTNFANWTFDGSKSNNSPGSFTRTSTAYANITSDDYFPVNANQDYRFEFDLMSSNNVGTMYAYLGFYDVDKISISASTHMYYPNTLTTLTRELKAGDTKVYLSDVSAYRTYGTGSHQRALIFWDYKNSFGYQYPPETYSRYTIMPAWVDDSSIDYTNNIITLASAYTGVTHPVGTYVSQGNSGGTYKYSGITGTTVPTSWTHYTGYFNGVDYSGTNKAGLFPPATAYCNVGFLWNYNSANDQIWATNISVKEVPVATDAVDYGGIDTGLGSGTPAANAKEYYVDENKVKTSRVKFFYNTSGAEYTSIFSKGSGNGNYGTILKWGQADSYLRILRRVSGNWATADWEKIYAGYADSSASAQQLSLSSAVTGATVNDFKGSTVKVAQISAITISGLASSDGVIVWIPWSTTYGRQLIFDDTTQRIFSRYYNNGTWGSWESIAILNKSDANALMNALDTGSSTPVDADYYISQYVGGGTTTTTYHRRPVSALWEYMKGKISSVLGLTATQYGGNAATATNATTVNSHTVNSDVPANAKFTDTVTTATTTGSGNAVTAITATNGALSVTKGTTFLTQHQDISGKADKATTLAGYGITDAKIASGTITLGSNTITPLTSHQDISGKADKSATVSTVTWDSTNKKFTKTINGTTTDIVTAANLRTGLNVADGAEVNQNAFSNVTVGSTTIAADTKTDTLTLTAGSNVTLTPDATNDKITIAATDTTYESKAAASGGTAVSLVTTGEKYTWNNKSTVPTNHASSATTYGTGTSSNYGHLKLSDSTSSTSGTSGGIAATPSAVKSAYDLANTANGTANTALSGVNGNLIYDHTFSISNGVATFTPHVYQKGAEVTTNYAVSCFTWKYRLIDGSEVTLTTKSDRGCDVTITNLGYGGHVIGSFTPPA